MRKIQRIIFCITFCTLAWGWAAAQDELRQQADAEYELMDFGAAIGHYTQYLKQRPADKAALIRLAECYEFSHDRANAAKWYYEALGHDISPSYLLKHGKMQMQLGRYEAAKQQFQKYRVVDDETGMHYANMCDAALRQAGTAPDLKAIPLPQNTPHADFSPQFFKGQLAFVSARKDVVREDAHSTVTTGNGKRHNYLFSTNLDGDSEPKYIRSWLHDGDLLNEGPVSYAGNGGWVAYVENHYLDGVSQIAFPIRRSSIFIAKVEAGGDWGQAEPFPYNGDYSNHYPHLSPDGQKLYFASDRPGGEGGYDIYMSHKLDGKWQEPINLGGAINKPGHEISPYFDGTDFYFSSDYHTGIGGQDVFRAEYDAGIWKVFQMGREVNSPANDFGFIYNKNLKRGYFVSDRNGQEDIYQVSNTAKDMMVEVKDAATQQPIEGAILDFKHCGKGVFRTDAEGRFPFRVFERFECWVAISQEGYELKRVALDESEMVQGHLVVFLAKEGYEYLGKVGDATRNLDLADARVMVLNQKTGKKYEVYTDQNGIYRLMLQPETAYMLQFSKRDYVTVNTKVNTGDGADKGILGAQLLFPSHAKLPPPSVPAPENPFTSHPPSATPSAPAVPPGQEGEQPATPSVPSPTGGLSPSEFNGFAVQVISLSTSNPNFPDNLKVLKGKFKQVYVKIDADYKRFRLGTYASRAEAELAEAKAKALGFPRAYVVEEDGKGFLKKVY